MEVNKIKELYPGHYQVILDFPTPSDLEKILDTSYKYVWGIDHNEERSSWSEYQHTLFGVRPVGDAIYARNIVMEFLIETSDFLKLLPNIKQTIKIIQTDTMPPPYLDLSRLKGNARYALLKEKVNYLFEIEIPGAVDYAPIISPDLKFLEDLVSKFT